MLFAYSRLKENERHRSELSSKIGLKPSSSPSYEKDNSSSEAWSPVATVYVTLIIGSTFNAVTIHITRNENYVYSTTNTK